MVEGRHGPWLEGTHNVDGEKESPIWASHLWHLGAESSYPVLGNRVGEQRFICLVQGTLNWAHLWYVQMEIQSSSRNPRSDLHE